MAALSDHRPDRTWLPRHSATRCSTADAARVGGRRVLPRPERRCEMARASRARSAPGAGLVYWHLEDCWDEPDQAVRPAAELEALQGRWVCVSGRRETELLVSG